MWKMANCHRGYRHDIKCSIASLISQQNMKNLVCRNEFYNPSIIKAFLISLSQSPRHFNDPLSKWWNTYWYFLRCIWWYTTFSYMCKRGYICMRRNNLRQWTDSIWWIEDIKRSSNFVYRFSMILLMHHVYKRLPLEKKIK